MSTPLKPIYFSQHAIDQMRLRGATEDEVSETIQTGAWTPAKQGKLQTTKTFPFGRASPVNAKIYPNKTVHVIIVDEPVETIVVTVLVYYG